MIASTLLAALLFSTAAVPESPAPWSYYCWTRDPVPHPPTFKIDIQGVRGRGHAWLMTWKDWQARAQAIKVDGESDVERITWLAKDKRRQSGRIHFSGPFADGMPRMLMIKIGETQEEPLTCIPAVLAAGFSPEERPDF